MAITFIQERKKQQYLIFVAIIIILAVLIVIWFGFLNKPKSVSKIEVYTPEELKINFEVLNSQILKEAQPFEEITPFIQASGVSEAIGRENPFIIYEVLVPSPTPTPKK